MSPPLTTHASAHALAAALARAPWFKQVGALPDDCDNITATLTRHASMLTEVGVDFAVADSTNIQSTGKAADALQLRPFEVMLEEWSALRAKGIATPKLAIWQNLQVCALGCMCVCVCARARARARVCISRGLSVFQLRARAACASWCRTTTMLPALITRTAHTGSNVRDLLTGPEWQLVASVRRHPLHKPRLRRPNLHRRSHEEESVFYDR